MDIYKIIVFSIQIRYDARKMFVMLVEVRHQRFPSVYLHSTIALVLNDVKLCQFVPIYHNLSQFVTNYRSKRQERFVPAFLDSVI